MDLQKLVDAMNEQSCQTRADYHLTLGGLLEALQSAPPDHYVMFDDDVPANTDFHSYRGYYSDVAISARAVDIKVRDFILPTQVALSSTFEGYKGGLFPADPHKPLWRSEYGHASEIAIMGAEIRDSALVLVTKHIP